MNAGPDIICFAKDWHEPKTSNNHVMEALSRTHRVLWVNSIATRAPNLSSGNDLRKIVRKVRSWFRGVERVSDTLRVFTPVVLPLPKSRVAQAVNRKLVSWGVRLAARQWGFSRPQLWVFLPNAVDYVGAFGESVVVYYCVDEWAQFTHLDAGFIRSKEAELLKRADVVFVVSRKLLADKSQQSRNVHLIPHGVDRDLFAKALNDDLPVATALRDLPRPILGFFGTLYDWVDQRLIADMARLRPSWSFALVGKVMTDVSTLRGLPNVHLFESQPHGMLPSFCKGFDVGLIPYRLEDPRMQSVNPLKLREYLAAGVPVVTVDLPEVRQAGDDVIIAAGPEAFVSAAESLLASESDARARARSERMRSETWEARVAVIERCLAEAGR